MASYRMIFLWWSNVTVNHHFNGQFVINGQFFHSKLFFFKLMIHGMFLHSPSMVRTTRCHWKTCLLECLSQPINSSETWWQIISTLETLHLNMMCVCSSSRWFIEQNTLWHISPTPSTCLRDPISSNSKAMLNDIGILGLSGFSNLGCYT